MPTFETVDDCIASLIDATAGFFSSSCLRSVYLLSHGGDSINCHHVKGLGHQHHAEHYHIIG